MLPKVLREAFNEKKSVKIFHLDPSLASSHWLRPDLDAHGCYLLSDELILIVLNTGHVTPGT